MREELGLVGGHIDADRAFGLACLARETEIQRLLELLALPAARDRLAAQHLEEEMGAAARRVLLVPRHHVARTHRPFTGLPALADADAAQRGSRDAPFRREMKKGARRF